VIKKDGPRPKKKENAMSSYRRGRINEAIAQELSVALREARDPVLASAFVSVTRAEAAPDLKIAKIYFSHLSGEEKEVKKALERATGMLRRHLAMTLNLRITPELIYAPDRSGAHGARISELLHQIEQEDRARAERNTQGESEQGENDGSV
jgi:ribosome-binding factor A